MHLTSDVAVDVIQRSKENFPGGRHSQDLLMLNAITGKSINCTTIPGEGAKFTLEAMMT
jgi:hypothetical protein